MAINKKAKWGGIWKSIKSIDKDSNGFVTIDELEEIFREQFPVDLEGKTLTRYFRFKYGSDANKNLINYKQLKNDINAKIGLSDRVNETQSSFPKEAFIHGK